MSSQNPIDDFISNSFLLNHPGPSSPNTSLVSNITDTFQQNFQYALGPTNPVFKDAILSYHDILVWGYTLQYNLNGILWRVDPAGRPHPDDWNNFLEQNRIIQKATERTMAEIKTPLETSQGGQASHDLDTHLNSRYQDPNKPFDMSLKDTFSAKGMDQVDYVETGKPVYFSQYDKNWAKIKVSETNPEKDIASSGCGLIAMTMVVATVTGRTDVTPAVLAEDVKKYMTDTEGTGWKFYPDMAAKHGIHCDIIDVGGDPAKNPDKAKAALNQVTAALNSGKLVIAAMGKGHFTSEGHMLLLYATETGGDGAVRYKVYDPNSSNYNRYNDNLVIVDGPGSERANTDVFIKEGWCYWIFSK